MRILIADDSVAASKSLRPLFRQGASSRGKKNAARRGSPALGQVIVSCAPAKGARGKRSRGRAPKDECACSGLDLGDQPELAATILDALGVALLNRGCLTEGGPLIEQALRIRRNYFGDAHPATAASQISHSRLLRELGDYKGAETAARESLRINKRVFGPHGMPVAPSLNVLGVAQLAQGEFDAALESANKGLEILDAHDPLDRDPNVTRLMDVQGRAQTGLGQLDAAADTYKRLLDLDVKQLGTKDHPKYATHLANAAIVREAQGDRQGAEGDYRHAIDAFQRSLNRPCLPNLLDTYANLGSLLRERDASGDRTQAGRLFTETLRLDRRVRGESHVAVANDHANLGRWQYDRKKPEALQSFATAVTVYAENIDARKFPAEHYLLAEARTWQGRILVERGDRQSARTAEPILELALAKWPAQLGPDTVGEGIAKACLGWSLYLQRKDLPRSRQLLAEGLAIAQQKLPADHPLVRQFERWLKEAGGAAGRASL
ncbi:MAG TPA: tetratricopeptide repeat protein [Steroidobacteraceae bacterium]|jgi:tetratricopeptide (TPR) repeat protein